MREILNYVFAAEHAFEWVVDRPLTSVLLGALQGFLVQGTGGEHSDAGGLATGRFPTTTATLSISSICAARCVVLYLYPKADT